MTAPLALLDQILILSFGAQIILTLLVLVRILGWIAVGSGMLVILLAIPLASLITFIFSKVRVKLLECTDSRVKLISEVRSAMRLQTHPDLYQHKQACSQVAAFRTLQKVACLSKQVQVPLSCQGGI